MAHGYIYGLYHPLRGDLRYIGQTTTGLTQRLASHVCPSSLKVHTAVARWTKGLVERGLKPVVRELDRAWSQPDLDELERQWISRSRAQGYRLLNLTEGGSGCSGHVVTAETRAKISRAQKGRPRPKHSLATRQRMSDSRKGRRTNSPEHYAKLAALKRGVPRSPETRRKISEANKGRPGAFLGPHTEATKQKISESRSGQLTGSSHPQFRRDFPTDLILRRLEMGVTKAQAARDLGVSRTFLHRRLKAYRREVGDLVVSQGR
jgi:hypothetical protein